jgi:hypothetical protein
LVQLLFVGYEMTLNGPSKHVTNHTSDTFDHVPSIGLQPFQIPVFIQYM